MLAIVHAGEVFGEIAMLDGKPRSADAKALTACDLAVVDRRDILAALERNPAAWRGLVEVLCSRMRRTWSSWHSWNYPRGSPKPFFVSSMPNGPRWRILLVRNVICRSQS
jgi:hypothetical protein